MLTVAAGEGSRPDPHPRAVCAMIARTLALLLGCRKPIQCDFDLADWCAYFSCADLPEDVVTTFDQTDWEALRQCDDLYEITDVGKEEEILLYYAVETRELVGVVYRGMGLCERERYGDPMSEPCASEPIVQRFP